MSTRNDVCERDILLIHSEREYTFFKKGICNYCFLDLRILCALNRQDPEGKEEAVYQLSECRDNKWIDG